MKTQSIFEGLKASMTLWLLASGTEIQEDDLADFVTVHKNEKTAYFLQSNTENIVAKAMTGHANYDKMYLVFSDVTMYHKIRNTIPKCIGIILYGNLYGTGNMFSIIRQAGIG